MKITPAHCRAARGLLDISQDQLAEMSGVSKRSIGYFEAGERQLIRANMNAIVTAFEAAGVVFSDGDEPGVRLRSVPKPARGDGQDDGPDAPPAIPKPKPETRPFA